MKYIIIISICLVTLASCRKESVADPCKTVNYYPQNMVMVGNLNVNQVLLSYGCIQDTGSHVDFYFQDSLRTTYWSKGSSLSDGSGPNAWNYADIGIYNNTTVSGTVFPYRGDSAVIYLRYAKSMEGAKICSDGFDTLHFKF